MLHLPGSVEAVNSLAKMHAPRSITLTTTPFHGLFSMHTQSCRDSMRLHAKVYFVAFPVVRPDKSRTYRRKV